MQLFSMCKNHAMKKYWENEVEFHAFLNSGLHIYMSGQLHIQTALPPWVRKCLIKHHAWRRMEEWSVLLHAFLTSAL
jgi:hypothetical protein